MSVAALLKLVQCLVSILNTCVLKIMLNLEWLTQEQEFTHHQVMMDAKKLNREQLLQIFESVHQQYQIQHRLFSRLASWCDRNGTELPSFAELLKPKTTDHPVSEA